MSGQVVPFGDVRTYKTTAMEMENQLERKQTAHRTERTNGAQTERPKDEYFTFEIHERECVHVLFHSTKFIRKSRPHNRSDVGRKKKKKRTKETRNIKIEQKRVVKPM